VPPATLFSEALYAHLHKNQFFWRSGFHEGRWTTRVIACVDPQSILHGTASILSQFEWSNVGIIHGMSGALSKPKLCVNVPFGQEEPHFQPMKNEWFDFRRPSLHLAGPRYPKAKIPTNHFAGFSAYLKPLNSYVFDLFQVTELLRPPTPKDSPLIWNRRKSAFKSFEEAIKTIVTPETQELMQKQFWDNLSQYVADFDRTEKSETGIVYTSMLLQMLIDLDLDKMFHDYLDINPIAIHYEADFKELKRYMRELIREARYYKEFAVELNALMQKKGQNSERAIEKARKSLEHAHGKSITKMPYAKTLYLLARSVGAGGFHDALTPLSQFMLVT
jgi:hypothetical protein